MRTAICLLTLCAPAALAQQSPPLVAPAAEQIAAALLPLPEEFRDGATVMGYTAEGKLVALRRGTRGMTCLANAPGGPRFHVACYHDSLEPFMARGRELRASGMAPDKVDTVRFAEVEQGKIPMPPRAALYSITGERYDAAADSIVGGRRLFVVYIPNATAVSTGLSAQPRQGEPWIMFPGTPKAHIMFIPRM